MNNETGETFWDPSPWLIKQNLQLPPEDQALYDSLSKIKELEEMLKKKDEEIKAVKQKRFEELEVRPTPVTIALLFIYLLCCTPHEHVELKMCWCK